MTLNDKLLNTSKLFSRENDIIQWGLDRNIIGDTAQGTFSGQQEKTRQEWQEWKDNHTKDDIGDQFVTLVMGAALKGTTVSECVNLQFEDGTAFGEVTEIDLASPIGTLKPEDLLDHFAQEYLKCFTVFAVDLAYYVDALSYTAKDYGWTLEECIEEAWNDIKDRKGLMVHGMFIKQTNLDALSELGITYDKELQAFTGIIYLDKHLKRIDEVLYNLGITYTNTGNYSSGILVESTGKL